MTVFVLAAAGMFAGCENGNNPNPDGTYEGEPDFASRNTGYSILVRNNTGERLVAFKGDLKAEAVIGGIKAHAQNHGLPLNAALFDKTEDFPLILLTEKQFKDNKGHWNELKDTPFTRVYVFYNKNGDNAAGLGGNNKLVIINPSASLNIEPRLGGVAGETIGYAPGGMLRTTLKLNDGNYEVFPVFKRYNRQRDVVDTVYPKNSSNLPWSMSFGLGDDGGNNSEEEMNMKTLLSSLTMTSVVA